MKKKEEKKKNTMKLYEAIFLGVFILLIVFMIFRIWWW